MVPRLAQPEKCPAESTTQAVLRVLAAWREKTAQALDRPRGACLRMNIFWPLPRRPAPQTAGRALRFPRGRFVAGGRGETLLGPWPSSLTPNCPARACAAGAGGPGVMKALKVVAQEGADEGLAPELVGRKKLRKRSTEDAIPEPFWGGERPAARRP